MSTIHLPIERLADRPVADAITVRGKELPVDATVGAARALLGSTSVRVLPLLDEDGRYVASVRREAIEAARNNVALVTLATDTIPTSVGSTPLRDALATLDADGGKRLVVVDEQGAYVGLVCLRSDRQHLCVDAECQADATVDPAATVAGLVVEHASRAAVFERLGIDYCCGGNVTLADACSRKGLDVDEVVAQLEAASVVPDDDPDWSVEPIEALVTHILDAHHAYLKAELPQLGALVAKVAAVHGDRHPELRDVEQVFTAIDGELRSHMPKEEMILFPACLALAAGELPQLDIAGPVAVMVHEHADVGESLERLRALTDDYAVHADACTSYRAMLERLETLEADTHRHIHEENNILFPRALELAGGIR